MPAGHAFNKRQKKERHVQIGQNLWQERTDKQVILDEQAHTVL